MIRLSLFMISDWYPLARNMDPGDGNDTEDWQPEGVSGQCSSSSSIIKSQSVSVFFF